MFKRANTNSYSLEHEINLKQKEVAAMQCDLLNSLKEKIDVLEATVDRKAKIAKRFQSDWRQSIEEIDAMALSLAVLNAENDKLKAKLAKVSAGSNSEIAENNDSNGDKDENARLKDEIARLKAEMERLKDEMERIKAGRINDKKKIKAKNIKIRQLKSVLTDLHEGAYYDHDDVGEDEEIADDDDSVGDKAILVDIDTDRDIIMSDKADKSDDDEEKDEENDNKKIKAVTANELLEASDTDPSDESFEVNDELIKAELKEKEKDKKHSEKEAAKATKKKSKAKKTKTKRKKKAKKSKKGSSKASSRSGSLVVNENEI